MRLLYDGTIFGFQAAGGISRYFTSLIRRLPADWQPSIITPQVENLIFPEHPHLHVYRWRRFRPTQLSNVLERRYFQAVVRRTRPRLVHPTYYTLLTRRQASANQFDRNYRCPVVLNVWDMIHEVYPRMIEQSDFWAARKREAVQAADAVICISEHTKRDLLERLPVPEEKVFVVPLASDLDERLAHGDEPTPPSPYFLYVGGRSAGYKNFDGLLAAFARVAAQRPEPILAVVGPPLTAQENQRIDALGISGRVQRLPMTSDSGLAKLYRCAQAFVYPSLYEGFGIPPLEAMACGTAVIASDRSSLPEVVGEAGLSFDPTNPDATEHLAAHLLSMLDDPSRRAELISRGRERAKLFSWDLAAAQTLAVYRRVLGG